jgi:hypothetical protein
MTIICLIKGCEWVSQPQLDSSLSMMQCERCIRCGAQRYHVMS